MSDEIKISVLPDWVDELEFVDKDLAELFKGKSYNAGTPTLLQILRELKLIGIYSQQTINILYSIRDRR